MSSIAQKIAKLIAKADSTTHAEEADLFMAKAQELMVKHGLNLLDLGRLSEDPVDLQRDAFSTSATYPWMVKIADALSAYYGCTFVRFQRGNAHVYSVIGRESARITFTLMIPFVQRQVQALGRQAFNEGTYPTRAKACTMIGNALARRIWTLVPEMAKHEGNGVNALVPVDIMESIKQDAFPDARTPRSSRLTTDAYAQQAASKVSINRQATAQAAPRLQHR